jgi:hypothetical protein
MKMKKWGRMCKSIYGIAPPGTVAHVCCLVQFIHVCCLVQFIFIGVNNCVGAVPHKPNRKRIYAYCMPLFMQQTLPNVCCKTLLTRFAAIWLALVVNQISMCTVNRSRRALSAFIGVRNAHFQAARHAAWKGSTRVCISLLWYDDWYHPFADWPRVHFWARKMRRAWNDS